MHLTCYFRSWDAFGGLPANIAGLQLFNEAFVNEINERGNLSLKTGKLIFHSKNCHIYQRQYNLVKELLEPKESGKRMAKTLKQPGKKAKSPFSWIAKGCQAVIPPSKLLMSSKPALKNAGGDVNSSQPSK
jgi:thymidylate synthase